MINDENVVIIYFSESQPFPPYHDSSIHSKVWKNLLDLFRDQNKLILEKITDYIDKNVSRYLI